jgi:hypothetical protein
MLVRTGHVLNEAGALGGANAIVVEVDRSDVAGVQVGTGVVALVAVKVNIWDSFIRYPELLTQGSHRGLLLPSRPNFRTLRQPQQVFIFIADIDFRNLICLSALSSCFGDRLMAISTGVKFGHFLPY